MHVILFDPRDQVRERAERLLPARSVSVVAVQSVTALSTPLTYAGVDDVLIAHVNSHEQAVEIVTHINERRFSGRTFLLVEGLEHPRLESTARLESLPYSPLLVEALLTRLPNTPPELDPFHGLIGRSKAMREVYTRVAKAAAGDANVCIYGESGTGKELLARAIHALSDRRHGPLVTFDCTAVPEGLAESQLFGHVRGAFTGAVENRDGVFAQANNGTLFIDELCELSLPLQAKLLRVVQGREFVKVGGTKTLQTNLRLVTATNRDPKAAVDAGKFRADLYYRLAVVVIKVPALRERREDIPALVEHFVSRYASVYKKRIRGVEPSALQRMSAQAWPGNVRQLENCLAQAVVLAEGDLLTERDLFADDAAALAATVPDGVFDPRLPLREVERRHILRCLQTVHGNRTEAAKLLGISVRCLQYKLKAYMYSAGPVGRGEVADPLLFAANVASQ